MEETNTIISKKLGLRDIEMLTKQEVVRFYEQGKHIVFVLGNGIKVLVEKW